MIVLCGLPVAFVSALVLAFTMHESNYGDENDSDEGAREDYRHSERIFFITFLVLYMLSISIGLSTTIWGITSEIIPNYLLA